MSRNHDLEVFKIKGQNYEAKVTTYFTQDDHGAEVHNCTVSLREIGIGPKWWNLKGHTAVDIKGCSNIITNHIVDVCIEHFLKFERM